jgi:hypothetical protein
MLVGRHQQAFRRGRVLIALFLTGVSLPALGQDARGSCKSSGGLRFVGTNADQSKSVWLSGTIAGSYRLEAAQAIRPSIPGRLRDDAGCTSRHRRLCLRATAALTGCSISATTRTA